MPSELSLNGGWKHLSMAIFPVRLPKMMGMTGGFWLHRRADWEMPILHGNIIYNVVKTTQKPSFSTSLFFNPHVRRLYCIHLHTIYVCIYGDHAMPTRNRHVRSHECHDPWTPIPMILINTIGWSYIPSSNNQQFRCLDQWHFSLNVGQLWANPYSPISEQWVKTKRSWARFEFPFILATIKLPTLRFVFS